MAVNLYEVMVKRPGDQEPHPEYFQAGVLVEVEPGKWVKAGPGDPTVTPKDVEFLRRYGF